MQLKIKQCGVHNLFVDAWQDRQKEIVNVVERVNGKRVMKVYPCRYVMYYADAKGKFVDIAGNKLSRIMVGNAKAFDKEKRIHGHGRTWESDYRPLQRCLEENYNGQESPKLQVAFFDIEVDYDREKGFSDPSDPFNPVTAVTVHLGWLDRTITFVVAPKKMSKEHAESIVSKFDDTILCETEDLLLEYFLDIIEDADVLSGWNSEGYDIPYMVNRVTRVLGKDQTRRFCLWDRFPTKREFERYGKTQETFDTIGRVHLDYLELYRKYNYHEQHTYRLDAIGEFEIGEKKIPYEGSLDQLYNNDFEKFIAYNRQDVVLLKKLDDKLQFIDLTNLIAHSNTVTLRATMGAVAVTDQALVNEAHSRGMIVPDRPRRNKEVANAAAGAYVAVPKKGMHEWIGSMDLNSLYPSIIRALNMSPETIVGQVRQTETEDMIESFLSSGKGVAEAWEGKFACPEYEHVMNRDKGITLTVDWENNQSEEMSAAEIYDLVFFSGQSLMMSSNGTIFSYAQKGIIPGLLERWYAERKELQAELRKAETKEDKDFWDKRQLVKKINLNSAYGALLNAGSRFFDMRLGQSTTLTGRCIARHMAGAVNESFTGKKDHVGDAVIYGDTDSVYFSAYPLFKDEIESGKVEWTKDKVIEIYDTVAEQVNDTFPGFMNEAFNCPQVLGEVIKAGREVVASRGIYMTKKRYAVMIYDEEGSRKDTNGSPGKLKAMGLDMKRADTPEFMQRFLEEILGMTLEGTDPEIVMQRVKAFREEFKSRPGWEKGTPKRVNNLTKHTAVYDKTGKCRIGHALAAINWNRLKKAFGDQRSMDLTDGQKTIVCKLKNNPMQINSIGYPIDELNIPDWFKELPFDHDAMEETIIDSKIDNLLGVLKWDLSQTKDRGFVDDLFG
jgi:DNA polymerase elongation subunit (family B)